MRKTDRSKIDQSIYERLTGALIADCRTGAEISAAPEDPLTVSPEIQSVDPLIGTIYSVNDRLLGNMSSDIPIKYQPMFRQFLITEFS